MSMSLQFKDTAFIQLSLAPNQPISAHREWWLDLRIQIALLDRIISYEYILYMHVYLSVRATDKYTYICLLGEVHFT